MNITQERFYGTQNPATGQSYVIVSNPGSVSYAADASQYYAPRVMTGVSSSNPPPANNTPAPPSGGTINSPPSSSTSQGGTVGGSNSNSPGFGFNPIGVIGGVGSIGSGARIIQSGDYAGAAGRSLQGGLDNLGARIPGGTLGDEAVIGEVGEVAEGEALLGGAELSEAAVVVGGEAALSAAEIGAVAVAGSVAAPVIGAALAVAAIGAGVYEIGESVTWGGENVWEHADDVVHDIGNFLTSSSTWSWL